MTLRWRSELANDLAYFSFRLGRLTEAWAIRQVDNEWSKLRGEKVTTGRLNNWSDLAYARGRLVESRTLSNEAVTNADAKTFDEDRAGSLAGLAFVMHALGDIPAARAGFCSATTLEGSPLSSVSGIQYARHHLDLGELAHARTLCEYGLERALEHEWNVVSPWVYTLLARIDLCESNDPTPHLDKVRTWTARTGEMEHIIEAHLLTARYLVSSGDPQAARDEAEAGLLHAVSCGFEILRIELLVAVARIWLAWPDPPRAIQAAREGLDLATHPDCQYAWGEADAAQVWGEAYFANHEPTLAKRAFARALEVRRRIEHPGVAETETWLARVG
jgi:tetratricopeptide (TPR) repeat protein